MSREVTVLAIDPGSSSGALALSVPDAAGNRNLEVIDMPDTPMDIFRKLSAYAEIGKPNIRAVVEDVGTGRPGNSAHSMYKFAVHRGHLEMALLVCGYEVIWVRPQKWLKDLFGSTYPTGQERKDERKRFVYEKMQERWPRLDFKKDQADALAILSWAKEKGAYHVL